MNLKRSLSALIILTMLFTGCSNYQVQNEGITLPDEATKQKTMTKVQNDVNEIINKDYDYVLSNLGKPNATAYWIDKNKIDSLDTLDDAENLEDINLVYLKKVSDENTNSTSLYLHLKNKIVKNAQIVDYSNSRSNITKGINKSKILIDCYDDGEIVEMSHLDTQKLNTFIGDDSREISTIVGHKQPSYDAYLYDKVEKSINVFKLDNEDKLLAIFTKDNKISEIKILDNKKEVINEIKYIMLDN
ncbi:MAG: hypothetical protein E6356_05620 [Terrisporobacter othiniensis]|uniref:Lipoprotein n=1 Tax=Terrisporobacter hibernicus TaxID=2813371 RepID=A0AAX2ZB46_9FIRM|nr:MULTISPECIES: hypothetical protein [Terrisporobacter]MDU4860100.1 hypothetical protein [Terrisporobacter othiniensis]MDU6994310.1 hypothetical protein [Terrisporobacter othiniensis]UEL46493.1 hypothetical protein JW646_12665 [Terrisporobacter hibernicus]SFI94883.1 hypothetical protein SAMN02910355_0261 [Terrisporobacter glycolicus]